MKIVAPLSLAAKVPPAGHSITGSQCLILTCPHAPNKRQETAHGWVVAGSPRGGEKSHIHPFTHFTVKRTQHHDHTRHDLKSTHMIQLESSRVARSTCITAPLLLCAPRQARPCLPCRLLRSLGRLRPLLLLLQRGNSAARRRVGLGAGLGCVCRGGREAVEQHTPLARRLRRAHGSGGARRGGY